MSIQLTKKERKKIQAYAYTLSWRINHGSMEQCTTMAEHIKAMDDLGWWEYAIEKKADGLGSQYHLHMELVFLSLKIRDSVKTNIFRNGKSIGLKENPDAKITKVSVELNRAFDEHWIENYCLGKEFEEAVKHDIKCEFPESLRSHFPSKSEQEEAQAIANAVDEKYEKLAIEFRNWCVPTQQNNANMDQNEISVIKVNYHYDRYTDGKINLTQLIKFFLFEFMVGRKKMMIPSERKKLVQMRQMLEFYLSKEEGKDYSDWFCTKEEVANFPENIQRWKEKKDKETDEFIKQYLDSD